MNRRRSGTTFGRSLRACSRIRARSEAGGEGRRPHGRAPRRPARTPAARRGTARTWRGAPRSARARPDPARRARSRRSVRVGPRRLHSLVQKLAQAREPGEHSALDRAERLPETLGELRLRIAAVVGELDRLALLVGQLTGARSARAPGRAAAMPPPPPSPRVARALPRAAPRAAAARAARDRRRAGARASGSRSMPSPARE